VSEWTVILLRDARRYLDKLPPREQDRMLDALARLEQDPFATDVKPLQGRVEWSLRVGEYRVLLRVEREERRLVVTRIGPRRDVYKR
jgi:mRNA interferase RelE/StbE